LLIDSTLITFKILI